MADDRPQYVVPKVLATPGVYVGTNTGIKKDIEAGKNTEWKTHVGMDGALKPDQRYVKNNDLEAARQELESTLKRAAALGPDKPEVKDALGKAIVGLEGAHLHGVGTIASNARTQFMHDMEAIGKWAVGAIGKKAAGLVGFGMAAGSFAASAAEAGGQVLSGGEVNTSQLKAAGTELAFKATNAAMDVVDPAGAIGENGRRAMAEKAIKGDMQGVGTAFNAARRATGEAIGSFLHEQSGPQVQKAVLMADDAMQKALAAAKSAGCSITKYACSAADTPAQSHVASAQADKVVQR